MQLISAPMEVPAKSRELAEVLFKTGRTNSVAVASSRHGGLMAVPGIWPGARELSTRRKPIPRVAPRYDSSASAIRAPRSGYRG
jgi:hypothetical protein